MGYGRRSVPAPKNVSDNEINVLQKVPRNVSNIYHVPWNDHIREGMGGKGRDRDMATWNSPALAFMGRDVIVCR